MDQRRRSNRFANVLCRLSEAHNDGRTKTFEIIKFNLFIFIIIDW